MRKKGERPGDKGRATEGDGESKREDEREQKKERETTNSRAQMTFLAASGTQIPSVSL